MIVLSRYQNFPFILTRVTLHVQRILPIVAQSFWKDSKYWIQLFICECHEQDVHENLYQKTEWEMRLYDTQNWHHDHLKISKRRWICGAFQWTNDIVTLHKFHFGTGNISFQLQKLNAKSFGDCSKDLDGMERGETCGWANNDFIIFHKEKQQHNNINNNKMKKSNDKTDLMWFMKA